MKKQPHIPPGILLNFFFPAPSPFSGIFLPRRSRPSNRHPCSRPFSKGGISLRPGTRKSLTLLWVFVLVWLTLRYLLPLVSPFLLGLALALAAEPMVSFLHRHLHIPRPVSAGIGVSMAFCLLAMVCLLLCAFLVRELGALAGVLPDLEQAAGSAITLARDWLLRLSAHAPGSLRPVLRENVTALFSDGASLLNRAVAYCLSLAGNLLSHIPDSALGLGTAILSGFMLSAKLPALRRWLLRRIPRQRLLWLKATISRLKGLLGAYLLAQAKLMIVTFTILCLGFTLLRIRYGFLWALGISLVDAFPVLGTGTVLIPWCVLCFLQGDTPRAMGLLGIYVTASLLRSALEPKLLGRHLGLDPLLTLLALYVGYRLWGIGGMLLSPLLVVTAVRLFPEPEPPAQHP